MDQLKAALDYSAPLGRFASRYPDSIAQIESDPHTTTPKPAAATARELDELMADIPDERALMRTLRHYRNREMTRILARDLGGAPLDEIAAELSDLAYDLSRSVTRGLVEVPAVSSASEEAALSAADWTAASLTLQIVE